MIKISVDSNVHVYNVAVTGGTTRTYTCKACGRRVVREFQWTTNRWYNTIEAAGDEGVRHVAPMEEDQGLVP